MLQMESQHLRIVTFLSKANQHFFSAIANLGPLAVHEPRRVWDQSSVDLVGVHGVVQESDHVFEPLVWGPYSCLPERAVPNFLQDWKRKELDRLLMGRHLDVNSVYRDGNRWKVVSVAEPFQAFFCEFCP